MRHLLTWLGLILLALGSLLWLMPLLPAVPLGGITAPHLVIPARAAAALTLLGVILMLLNRR